MVNKKEIGRCFFVVPARRPAKNSANARERSDGDLSYMNACSPFADLHSVVAHLPTVTSPPQPFLPYTQTVATKDKEAVSRKLFEAVYTRAARRRRTYGYGTAVWWYGYRTIGPLAGHLTVRLWYGFVPY
jgi:hypothetical protein